VALSAGARVALSAGGGARVALSAGARVALSAGAHVALSAGGGAHVALSAGGGARVALTVVASITGTTGYEFCWAWSVPRLSPESELIAFEATESSEILKCCACMVEGGGWWF